MDSKQRAKSYLFWLLEYRGRRFLRRVGWDGFEQLKPLMELYELYARAAGWKDVPDFAEHLKDMNHDALKSMCDYFTQYPEDYYFFGGTLMTLTTAEKIISLCTNGKIGEELWYFLDGQGVNTSCTTIDAYNDNGKEVIPKFHTMPVKDNKLILKDVSIDLNAPLADILTDVTTFVCAAREQAAILELGDPSNEEMKQLFGNGCPGFGPCRGACEVEDKYTFFAKIIRGANFSGYRYTARSDEARAVGIWLWDCTWLDGYTLAEAIRQARNQGFLNALGYGGSDDRVLQRMHERTASCIEQGDVLTMS